MKKACITVIIVLITFLAKAQTIENLKCDNQTNPFGLENLKPSFSWQIKSTTRATKQSAYQILISDSEANLKKDIGNIWNSGMIKTDQSFGIAYLGSNLESKKLYFWKVKIWNEKNKPTTYSEVTKFEMAILKSTDWTASWIGQKGTEGKFLNATAPRSIELQKEFDLKKRATKARIYVTGLGAYHLIFNGKKISKELFSPSYSDFSKLIYYQIYDIQNDDLTVGTNFITVTLGNGWWSSGQDFGKGKFAFSDQPNKLLFQMELEFYDGTKQIINSDETWKTRVSPLVINSIYSGEIYDARLEYGKDWVNASIFDNQEEKYQHTDVSKNYVFNNKNVELKFKNAPKEPIFKDVKAVKITESRKGRYVFDFGQNLIGYAAINVEGKAGKDLELKYAERLTDKGQADQLKSNGIKPTDQYFFKGYGVEKWEPKFSIHGFRFIEVDGLSKKPDENTVIAKMLFENTPLVENLAYGEETLQKIYSNSNQKINDILDSKIVFSPNLSNEEKIFETKQGQILTKNEVIGNKTIFKISIPANSSITLNLPLSKGKSINNIKESGKAFVVKKKPMKIEGVNYLKTENEKAVFEVLSGNYEFILE